MPEGPWGQSELVPQIDKKAERQMHVNRVISTIETKMRTSPETAHLQYLLTKKNTPQEHLTFEELTGDIREALPVVESAVAELNAEFSRLGFGVTVKVDYVPKGRNVPKPGIVISF